MLLISINVNCGFVSAPLYFKRKNSSLQSVLLKITCTCSFHNLKKAAEISRKTVCALKTTAGKIIFCVYPKLWIISHIGVFLYQVRYLSSPTRRNTRIVWLPIVQNCAFRRAEAIPHSIFLHTTKTCFDIHKFCIIFYQEQKLRCTKHWANLWYDECSLLKLNFVWN